MPGWYTLDRDILDHPLLKHRVRFAVFTRLIGMANFQDGSVTRRGHEVPLKRGQVAIAVRPWAEDIGYTYKEVRNALEVMQAKGMLRACRWDSPKNGATSGADEGAQAGAICTIITLCEYDTYQLSLPKKGATGGASKGAKPGERRAQLGRNSGAQQKKKKNSSLREEPEAGSADPLVRMWRKGVEILTAAGTEEKPARSLIGKWRQKYGEAQVLAAFVKFDDVQPSDPVPWLVKYLEADAKKPTGVHNLVGFFT